MLSLGIEIKTIETMESNAGPNPGPRTGQSVLAKILFIAIVIALSFVYGAITNDSTETTVKTIQSK